MIKNKKSAVKKSTVKKKENIHKDNKSHNVNIKVVSGINKENALKKYSELLKMEDAAIIYLKHLKEKIKKIGLKNIDGTTAHSLIYAKKTLESIKQQKAIQKKLI